jgi:hypothetical protein
MGDRWRCKEKEGDRGHHLNSFSPLDPVGGALLAKNIYHPSPKIKYTNKKL